MFSQDRNGGFRIYGSYVNIEKGIFSIEMLWSLEFYGEWLIQWKYLTLCICILCSFFSVCSFIPSFMSGQSKVHTSVCVPGNALQSNLCISLLGQNREVIVTGWKKLRTGWLWCSFSAAQYLNTVCSHQDGPRFLSMNLDLTRGLSGRRLDALAVDFLLS